MFRTSLIPALALALVAFASVAPPPAHAGATYSSGVYTATVLGHDTNEYSFTFDGGAFASVSISGDGSTDLDLYVYDEDGNLIASNTNSIDDASVSWVPIWTGQFTIHVVNRGRVYNDFVMSLN